MINKKFSFCAKNCFVALLAIMVCQCLNGYICTIYHLYNPKIKQHVFLFGDCHEGKNCQCQQAEIVESARKFNAHVIVEDNFVPFPDKSIADSFFEPLKGTPLMNPYYDLLSEPLAFDANKKYFGGLTFCPPSFYSSSPLVLMSAACSCQQISCHNVEWRMLMAASTQGASIPASDAYVSVRRALEELRHYQDGPALDAYYQTVIASCEKIFQSPEFKDLCMFDGNLKEAIEQKACSHAHHMAECGAQREWRDLVARYTQHAVLHATKVPNEKTCNPNMLCKETFLKDTIEQNQALQLSILAKGFLVLPWSSIIDARIIHEISQKQQQSVVFVCSGLHHISRVACQLAICGYNLINSDTAGKSVLEAWESDFVECECLNIDDYFKEYYCDKSPATPSVSTSAVRHDEQLPASERLASKQLAVSGDNLLEVLAALNPLLGTQMSCEDEAEMQGLKSIAAACRRIPLMLAIKAGARETLLQEIAQATKTDCQDRDGNTILACAIKLRAWDMVHELLRVLPGSHVTIANDYGFTPLKHAAEAGCDESIIHELVCQGADVNQNIMMKGRTALTYLLQSKHYNTATLKALLAHGAFPGFPYNSVENPLFLAAKHGHADAIDLLCKYGADLNDKVCWGSSLLNIYIEKLGLPTEHDIYMIKTMLANGADLQLKNSLGETPLERALLNRKWHAPEQLQTEYPLVKVLQEWLKKNEHHD